MSFAPFDEILLDLGYTYGTDGGPEFKTRINPTASGREYRYPVWSRRLGKWQIGNRQIDRSESDYIVDFFHARFGRYRGFRFLDWQDYEASAQVVTLNAGPTAQLEKVYTDTGNTYTRTIQKPNADVTMTRGGAAYGSFTVDTTTGIVTFAADQAQLARGITYGVTSVITMASTAGFVVGYDAWLTGLSGFSDQAAQITAIDAVNNTITVALDTSANTGSGSCNVYLYPQPTESMLWSGTFHVPARFDVDQLHSNFVVANPDTGDAVFDLSSLPVVEIRI